MSASPAFEGHVRYKEQLKLMRARTAAEWTTGAFVWAIEAVRAEPAQAAAWIEEAMPPRRRYYGPFY